MYVCMYGLVLHFSQAILVDNTVGYMRFIGNGQSYWQIQIKTTDFYF